MDTKKGLDAQGLADLRRLAGEAAPWQLQWAISEGRKRRRMFVAIDLEHHQAVLRALDELTTDAAPIRKLLTVIQATIQENHQRLPRQSDLAIKAGLTPAQTSRAVRWLAKQRVLCCRSETKGPRNSPIWEVYAGYASRLPEKQLLAEMDRQNAQDFTPGKPLTAELQAALDGLAARANAGELDPDAFSASNDPRQRNFDA